jgi:hypothetical protein
MASTRGCPWCQAPQGEGQVGIRPGVARADQPPIVQFAGEPFYFSGSCTGLGDVILVNQTLDGLIVP